MIFSLGEAQLVAKTDPIVISYYGAEPMRGAKQFVIGVVLMPETMSDLVAKTQLTELSTLLISAAKTRSLIVSPQSLLTP